MERVAFDVRTGSASLDWTTDKADGGGALVDWELDGDTAEGKAKGVPPGCRIAIFVWRTGPSIFEYRVNVFVAKKLKFQTGTTRDLALAKAFTIALLSGLQLAVRRVT